jgi:hypothetical protein
LNDPSAYWLNIMNAVLGLVVLICCAAVGVGIFQELAARRKKRVALAAMDREVSDLVAGFDGHAFQVPQLGLTMADGGTPVANPAEQPAGKKAGR